MTIFVNKSAALTRALESNTSIQQYIDSKIDKDSKLPFLLAKEGEVMFCEQFSNALGKAPWIRGFDLTEDFNETWNSNITTSPIENGDWRTVHISSPKHTITINGEISQIVLKNQSKTNAIQTTVRTELTRLSKYTPALATPVLNKFNQAANRINRLKSTAEGILADARGFYNVIKRLQGKDTSRKSKITVFKQAFIEAQNKRLLFTVRCGGLEYKDYAISSVKFSQTNQTYNNANFTVTFEQVILVDTARRVTNAVKNAVQAQARQYEEAEKKKSVGEAFTTLVRGGVARFSN